MHWIYFIEWNKVYVTTIEDHTQCIPSSSSYLYTSFINIMKFKEKKVKREIVRVYDCCVF